MLPTHVVKGTHCPSPIKSETQAERTLNLCHTIGKGRVEHAQAGVFEPECSLTLQPIMHVTDYPPIPRDGSNGVLHHWSMSLNLTTLKPNDVRTSWWWRVSMQQGYYEDPKLELKLQRRAVTSELI